MITLLSPFGDRRCTADEDRARRMLNRSREEAARKDKLLEEASEAAPSVFERYQKEADKAGQTWDFTCKRASGFLLVAASQDGSPQHEIINLSKVAKITKNPGAAPTRDAGMLEWTGTEWLPHGLMKHNAYIVVPFKMGFPSPAMRGSIKFVGDGETEISVPYQHVDSAYAAIFDAMTAS